MYQTYDVTGMIKAGDNALGAMLGEGWWSGLLSFGTIWNHFGDRQSLLAKLVVTYKDGTSDTVTTNDRTWKYYGQRPGRLQQPGLRRGVRRVQGGRGRRAGPRPSTTTARGSPRSSCRSRARRSRGRTAAGAEGRPGRRSRSTSCRSSGRSATTPASSARSTAKSVKEVRPRVYVYDMGQNLVGVPRISIANGRAGGTITLRYSEMLYPDLKESGKNVGMIMTENYRAALSQDVYTMKAGPQTFQPRFTSHGYPVRRDHRHRPAAPARGRRGRRHQLRPQPDGRLQDVQREGEPAVVEPGLVQRGQLPHDPDRLPAAQRAHGLVGRHQRVLAHRDVRLEREPVPHAPHVRDARRAGADGQVHRRRAGRRGLRRSALGQRRHRRAVGDVPAVQGRGPAGAALPGDGRLHGLPRDHDRSEDGPELGRAAGRLAGAPEQRAGERLPGHRLPRLRPRHHGEGRRPPRQARRRGQVPRPVREAEGVLQRHVRERREEDPGDRRRARRVRRQRGAAPAGPPEFRVADTQTSYAVRAGHGAVRQPRTRRR